MIGFVQNNLIDTIPTWGKEFAISFILLLQPRGTKGWKNILHFTTGHNYGPPGSRVPLIGLRDSNLLHITMDNDHQLTYDTTSVKNNKFLAIQISQRLENNKVSFLESLVTGVHPKSISKSFSSLMHILLCQDTGTHTC